MTWTPEDAQAIKAIFEPLIEPLIARMDSFSEELSVLGEKVDILTDRVDTLTDRVDTLTDRVDTLTDRVDTLTDRVDTLTVRMDNSEDKLEAVHQSQINMENVLPLKVAAALDGFAVNRDTLEAHDGRIDFLERKADIHDLRLFALEQAPQKA